MISQVDKNVTNSSLEASQGTFHWAYTGSPGYHQVAARGFSMSEIWSENSQSWCLKNFGSHWCQRLQEQGHLYKSGHETSRSSDAMHTPDADQQILSEMANQNLKKVNFWCVDKGALPPMTPVNPYLGGMHKKNGPPFNCQSIYACFGITSLQQNMALGVLLEPYISHGAQGVTETPIVSKVLIYC